MTVQKRAGRAKTKVSSVFTRRRITISTPSGQISSSSSGCMSLVGHWRGDRPGSGIGELEREGASCLAAVVELLEGLHSEEGGDDHGDPHDYKRQNKLRP